eukprot:TRINITY_DN22224_c0_g1_i1.p1 TRINITY_DN22224_c0_g1~~TRINITY_DN22224_c0_g1_i1.p1  ORF type:complete len:565 (+),score=130.05 TRINITY_DN22224_c0_g1_i1:213-1907(+)
MAGGQVTNGTNGKGSAPTKDISCYSPLQISRLEFKPTLPKVLQGTTKIVQGNRTSAVGNEETIAKLFPNMYGQPVMHVVSGAEGGEVETRPLKVGVVLSGGQAAGGHNVIAGLFDYLQERAPGSLLYGFMGGPAGIMKCKFQEITGDFLYPYRNQGGFDIIGSGRDKIETPEQFKAAEETAIKLDLDGLVVIGGDDSNTNACLLAENFRSKGLKTCVIGCPKTIDGDLKCKDVPISFGFDTACKTYSEMIGNIMLDARSAGKYYHFVRLMGRAASHITLECALQTHPNITLIGEEVYEKKQTLGELTQYIADIITARAEKGFNYGVVLIPEGLIDFIPEVHDLIAELNDALSKSEGEEGSNNMEDHLSPQTLSLFKSLPQSIQHQLCLDRDPHGNVQVARIDTECMLIQMVETELSARKQDSRYSGKFQALPHFFGYEGRCAFPSNFDAVYCYSIGFGAGALLQAGQTGLITSVSNLTAPPAEWTVGGTPLTELMTIEHRKGKEKPVIKKAMVELDGAPFKKFCSVREAWANDDQYRSPGPIQFYGPDADATNITLMLECEADL